VENEKMMRLNKKLIILASFALPIAFSASVWAATLVWDPNTDQVDGYKVYYGTSQSSLNDSLDVGNSTNCNLDQLPLSENVQYYFSVSAYNTAGESGKTSPLSYTPADSTPPSPPTGLEAFLP
jgi:hypothetical protein